ncbi:hypothetical protein HELRODRAFT_176075 [Helobdella robusta]|uniref:Uncharacterized protein n=1 Tax=Helobdella robusta TaxID=6412 RepID=T1FA42_HELRO|nr:hypothetical protein HELRODRAFT_176075 [Helobdella robusta]ESO00231.1 hypothetical protein HELRODRAFT_176075 [Helobdella robusta]
MPKECYVPWSVKTSSSSHYHDAENHCANSSKSIEPLLKIKISRLKDGSSNNLEKRRSTVLNQGCDSSSCKTNETNEFCCRIAANENTIDDSEETEKEELDDGDDDDAVNFVSLSLVNNNISHSKKNCFLKKKSPVKPKIKVKNLKKFSLNRVSMFANKNASKSFKDLGSKPFKLLSSKSVGTMTDVNLLGPCQPGTFIKMPGFIWTDSAQNG